MHTLIDRIGQGMSTEDDARIVRRMLERLAAYEEALLHIAVHGAGDAAWRAMHALATPPVRREKT